MTILVIQNDNPGDSGSKFVRTRMPWWRTVATVQIREVAFGTRRHSGLQQDYRKAGPNPAYGMQGLLDPPQADDEAVGQLVAPNSWAVTGGKPLTLSPLREAATRAAPTVGLPSPGLAPGGRIRGRVFAGSPGQRGEPGELSAQRPVPSRLHSTS